MKTKMLSLLALVFITVTTVTAQTEKTEKFEVAGNCGMCESRIEKAAKGVDGVISADWDKETKQMVVEYNESQVTIEDIHKAIAKVGHDTEIVKVDNKVYNALPGCCQYDRNLDDSSDHSEHNH